MTAQNTEKLQKILAREGLGSRRALEQWIVDGRVSINGRTAQLGDRAAPADVIRVDGRLIHVSVERPLVPRVLLYHKRIGEICTRRDEQERPTVFSALPPLKAGRWISVGRLDVNTAGLLLFTDNGELANTLMKPSQPLEHEYAVRVLGDMTDESMTRLINGVRLEDGVGRFKRLVDDGGKGANHWYHVVITESRPRFIRRMLESQGLTMSRLIRIRFGPVQLPRELVQGDWLELTVSVVKQLMKLS
jgi:23S rRNA pseudouridine2605 synthase